MAFGKDIGQISPVIVQPVSQVDVEPVDLSTSKRIDVIGKSIVSLKQSFQSADLKEDLEGFITGYIDSTGSPDALPDGAINKPDIAAELAEDFNEEDEADFNDPLLSQARGEMDSLTSAVESGVMDRSQLKIRVHARMREYINSAPAFAQHFRDLTSTTLGDYKPSIDAAYDRQVAASKVAVAERKSVVAMGQKLFVDPNLINSDWPKYKQLVSEAVGKKQGSISIQNQAAELAHDKSLLQENIRGNISTLIDHEFFATRGAASRIIQNPDIKPENKKQAIRDLLQQYVAGVKSYGIQGGAFGGTEVDNLMEHNVARMEQYVLAVDNTDQVKHLENLMKRDDLLAQQKWYANFPEARRIEFMHSKLGITSQLENVPGGVAAYTSYVTAIAGQDIFNTGVFAPPPGSKQEAEVLEGFYEYSRKLLEDYEPNDLLTPTHIKNLYEGPMKSWDATELPNDNQIAGFSNFLSTKSGLNGLQVLVEAGEEVNVERIGFTFQTFLKDRWLPNLNKVFSQEGARTDVEDIEDVAGLVDILFDKDTGALSFKWNGTEGANPEFSQFVRSQSVPYLNKELANRFNTLVKAQAHLNNPMKPNYRQTALDMYKEMLGQ